MLRKRGNSKGFTLIELLIVVAIIGIIAALLIPNFLDALQKSKQKRTVADMRNVGTAMMSWLTDMAQAGAAGAQTFKSGDVPEIGLDALASILVTQYIQEIPEKDGWKNDYEYRLDITDLNNPPVSAICSQGRDAKGCDGATYTVSAFDPTDYNQDIVWSDGFFVRWPQKTTQ